MEILRYTAFSQDPSGGNPAGVVLDATGVPPEIMLEVAKEVGFSETAFLAPTGPDTFDVRFFSPLAEVPFCGHATIASAVAHALRHGSATLTYHTAAGAVQVTTSVTEAPEGGRRAVAKLVSVPPRTKALGPGELSELLAALRWDQHDLHPAMPARVGFAGAWHPILATRTRARLAELDYDYPALGELMARHDWTTVQLVFRESPTVFHARNPFPPGGVVEDPATGAAAAALGGYLRELGLIDLPATLKIHQGVDMGRPGLLHVQVPANRTSGIGVAGTAVALD